MLNTSITDPPVNGKHRLADDALTYAGRGWSIIPTVGKKPATPWKQYQTTRPDEPTLRRLFNRPGITGLAVLLGSASGGLACRDFDSTEGYERWTDAHPDLAAVLPTVRTNRGFHVYCRSVAEQFADLGDGEFRADPGHYCVLPPSHHPDGGAYQWIIPPHKELPVLDPQSVGLLGVADCTQHTQATQGNPGNPPTQATHPTQQPIACVPCWAVDAIKATLPDGPGQRNHKVFELARRLKAIAGLDASALKAVVVEWHRQALPFINTKAFAVTWGDFQTAWLRVEKPYAGVVRAAYEAALRASPAPIDDDPDLGVLAALCVNLGAVDGKFFLSCRTVQTLFGVGRMTAWRWLQALQFYRVIEPEKVGTLKDRQATEWRFIGQEGGRP